MTRKTRSMIFFILLPLAVGALAAWLTREGMAAFAQLRQPALSPPAALFPVVWSILYLLMGIAAGLVWNSGSPARGDALFIFFLQLFVNFCWPLLFFAWRLRLAAFFVLLLLLLLVVVMLWRFWHIRRAAAYLNVPYLLWLLFAAYLNLALWFLNK